MSDLNTWTTVSITLPKERWHVFFCEILRPFVEHLKSVSILKSNFIELRNDSINISLRQHSFANVNLATEFKSSVRRVSTYDYKISKIRANNAVPQFHHFGFWDQSLDFYFCNEVSDLIMDTFSNESCADESVMLLSLYLHFAWIRMRNLVTLEPMSTIIIKGYSWFLPSADKALYQNLQESYRMNENAINGLYDKVMGQNREAVALLPPWMGDWMRVCNGAIHRNISEFFDQEHLNEVTYYLIPNLINKQLGITGQNILLQTYYINQAIISSAKKKLK